MTPACIFMKVNFLMVEKKQKLTNQVLVSYDNIGPLFDR